LKARAVVVRRGFLVVLTVLALFVVGYLAYAMSNAVRATGPAEPPAGAVREDAGEE
jgi:hypothetical protein